MENKKSFLVNWSKFFIDRFRVTILILIAVLLAGMWGVANNQRQDFPTIPINFVFVSAVYPGASGEDIEQEVIVPIEQVMRDIDGVAGIRSSAQSNFGQVTAELEDANKTETAAAEISDQLGKIGLPSDVETDIIVPDASGPAIAVGIVGENGQGSNDLLTYAAPIKIRLESSSPEIEKVEVFPENVFHIEIHLDAAKLVSRGLSYEQIRSTLQSQIASLPGGSVKNSDGRNQSITINAPATSIAEIESIPLGTATLIDVADIHRHPVDSESLHYAGFVRDGQAFSKESVYLLIYKRDDGDVIRISAAVQEAIDEMKSDSILPDDINIEVLYDTSPYIVDQIDSLLTNGYIGLVLILIVLLFFINFRMALLVAIMIPLVFLITLFTLNILEFSLNILTLFAMILTLGILVDNAIVISEGMVHELERGRKRREAALIAIKKFGPAITAATLTTIVVFIPFAMIPGIIGDFMKFIPFTIIIMLVASYFVAISITPLMGRWILREQTYEERRAAKVRNWERALILPAIVHYGQNLIDYINRGYVKLMRRIYKSRWAQATVIGITAVLIGVSVGFFAPRLVFEQFPTDDGATMSVNFTFPAGTPFEEQKEAYEKTQNEIITLPYFQNFYSFGNTLYITFSEPANRTDGTTIFEIEDKFNQQLTKVREQISEDITIKPVATTYGPPESEYDIVVEFRGAESDKLVLAADDLEKFLIDKEVVSKIENGPRDNLVQAVDVQLDQDKLAANNVAALAAAGTINAIFSPQNIGSITVRDDGITDDVLLVFTEESTDTVDDLNSLVVPSLTGQPIRLDKVANINEVKKPISIGRLDSRRVATVNVALSDSAEQANIQTEIEEYLSEDKLKELGLESDGVSYGGIFASFQADFTNLQIVFVLAMILVYLILVNQFNSYIQPGLILFAVPLALIGVFPGLYVIGSSLNMISGLGIIALVGVVVNDAIVFIDTFNRYRKEFPDESLGEILARTGQTRFKPIFSTSITTMGGILPLTLVDPFWRGLGTSIISGLIFSTVGTLIAIPVLYHVWKGLGNRLKRKKKLA
ncbi:efflux RND transporter permease subunit [Patescibacteria group bacterium]